MNRIEEVIFEKVAPIKDASIEEVIEEAILEEATTVAFCSLRKLHCTPLEKPNGRIAFKVRGNVSAVLSELQSNPKIQLLDYINRLKAVRSLIFSLKK